MPTYSAPVLPQVSGLAHGSPSQQWTYYGTLIGATALAGVSISSVTSSASMAFTGFGVYEITLTGNVTSSSFSGNPGYYAFIVIQDVAGNHTFTWPGSFVNAAVVSPTASGSLTQVFLWDGTTAFAISPGMVFP